MARDSQINLLRLLPHARITEAKLISFSCRSWENEVIIGTYLVLDEELDTLNGSGSSLRDGGRNTTHQEVRHEGL